MVHSLRSDHPDTHFDILQLVFAKVQAGGPVRTAAVIPPICFSALIAARAATASSTPPRASPAEVERWYRFVHRAASALADARAAEVALQLFLAGALSASQEARLELVAYECFEQAFTLFEESIPDSKQEVRALHSIVGTLHRCRVFGRDNRAALVFKATAYCSKLLRRADQCLAVLACSHLYWQEDDDSGDDMGGAGEGNSMEEEESDSGMLSVLRSPIRDAKGVLSCLKRALKIVNAAQQQLAVAERKGDAASGPGHLFVEILNVYLYWFDHGVEAVTPEVVSGVLELTASELSTEACREDVALRAFYQATLKRAAAQKEAGGDVGARYAAVQLPKA